MNEKRSVTKRDRRVEKTQRSLRVAMLELTRERGFESLSVQDIIDRANVGRATFYTHFENKEDLLASGFDELRQSLKARQREALKSTRNVEERIFGFTQELFVHANEHREVFRAMVGKQSGAKVQQLLHRIVVELVREDVNGMVRSSKGEAVPTEALVQYLAGACSGLLMWWINGRMRLSPEGINNVFRRLAIPAVKAAAG